MLNKVFRALELAVKHKMHIDTVLGYRNRYLDETGRKENDAKFLKQLSAVEVDWSHIREKIKLDKEKEHKIK
jgi:intraflagellar transport protein 80